MNPVGTIKATEPIQAASLLFLMDIEAPRDLGVSSLSVHTTGVHLTVPLMPGIAYSTARTVLPINITGTKRVDSQLGV